MSLLQKMDKPIKLSNEIERLVELTTNIVDLS